MAKGKEKKEKPKKQRKIKMPQKELFQPFSSITKKEEKNSKKNNQTLTIKKLLKL